MASPTSLPLDHRLLLPDVPELPAGHVARARLCDRLDRAVEQADVVSLVASAATGKTTLLLEWLAGRSDRVAYLSLDELDNNPGWFWARLTLSLTGRNLRADSAVGSPDSYGRQHELVRALRRELPDITPTILVLDDVHALTNPELVALLGELVEDLPPSLGVIVSGRDEPPWRLGLLRARGRLVDFPREKLLFERHELEACLASLDGHRLSTGELHLVHRRLGGWPGGVRLLANALDHADDPATVLETFGGSNLFVADFLRREVLHPLPEELQHFLLVTAVVDQLEPALYDAVTSSGTGGVMLDRLVRRGLALPDPSTSGYRYLPILQEFLRHELHLLNAETERRVHLVAAERYEDGGDIGNAVRHLLAADRSGAAVRLVARQAIPAMGEDRVDDLRRWIDQLPDQALVDNPEQWLALVQVCLYVGLDDQVQAWTDRLGWRLQGTDDERGLAELALFTAYRRARSGNLEGALTEAQRALSLAERAADAPPSLVARIRHLLALVYAGLEDFVIAEQHRAAAGAGTEDLQHPSYALGRAYQLGHLDEALAHADDLLTGVYMPWESFPALLVRGAVHRERGNYDDAKADLLQAVELAQKWSRRTTEVYAVMELALLRFARGLPAEAHQELAKAAAAAPSGTRLRHRAVATDAGLWLLAGDVERSRSVRRALPTGPETAVLDIRLALAAGELDEANRRIESLTSNVESIRDRITLSLLRARASAEVDEAAALQHLRNALDLGRPGRFLVTPLPDLAHLDKLVRQVVDGDSYAMALLAMLADCSAYPTVDAVLEPLSSREHAVLRFLPTRLSNKDIAAELHISLNTLKTHLKAIYRKLGTQSRRDAVAAARAFDLL